MNDRSTIPLAAAEDAILCVFASRDAANHVLEMLRHDHGTHIYEGEKGSKELQSSSQWFADTEKELAWYQRKLAAGMVALFIPVRPDEDREHLVQQLRASNVKHLTFFGQWTTERIQ